MSEQAPLLTYVTHPAPNPAGESGEGRSGLPPSPGSGEGAGGEVGRSRPLPPLYGLVLSGGQSTRMQQEKASLRYHGKPQAAHAFELLAAACDRAFISCRWEQAELHAGFPQIHDAYRNLGPLSGILSAMTAFPDAAWLVLANDLPHVTADTLQILIRQRQPAKIAVAYQYPQQAFPEPLCTIYEPAMRTLLWQRFEAGRYSLYRVLEHPDIRLLAPANGVTLVNVNDPDGYQQAVALLSNSYPPLPLPGGDC